MESVMIIDYAPTQECKHPEWTYGEICVQCGECGRFDKPPFVNSDIKIVSQGYEAIPPLWRYPNEFGGYCDFNTGKKQVKGWYRSDKVIEGGEKLTDILPYWWKRGKPEYHRWWIEGRNY